MSAGMSNYVKGVGEGGAGGGGARASPLSKVGGGHKWVCAPLLLGRAKVLISLFAHILWLKTHFSKFSWLASLANFNKSIFSELCHLKNSRMIFHIFFFNCLTIYTYIYHYINCVPTYICNFQI